MIEKKAGEFHVRNLRTILLLEADFNQGNKRLGRELMFNAEKLNRLAREQYGSRKFYTAINQGLNKRLTFDIWRQKNNVVLYAQPTPCRAMIALFMWQQL